MEVSTEKTMNLNSKQRPCSSAANYTEMELSLVGELLKKTHNCTSPFIPPELRHGVEICRNEIKGKLVQTMFRALSGVFATNNWKDNYIFLPPCTYNSYSYSVIDFTSATRKPRNIYLTKSKKSKSFLTNNLDIFFLSKMSVTEQFWSYTFLAYIAECGGFVGLFLGYSILQIGDVFHYIGRKFNSI